LRGFFNQGFQAAASEGASKPGDDAETAPVGTPLCDFEICAERRGRLHSWCPMIREKHGSVDEEGRTVGTALLEKFRDPMDFAGTSPSIYLGHFLPQFVSEPLHKTADDIKLTQLAFPFSFRHFEDGPDRFFDGRLDEPASVDHRDVRFLKRPYDRIFLL